MKIVQNTLKIEEKFSDVPTKFRVGPKKVGLVGFLETKHFFFFGPSSKFNLGVFFLFSKLIMFKIL